MECRGLSLRPRDVGDGAAPPALTTTFIFPFEFAFAFAFKAFLCGLC
jgi:hypothetical protein